MGIGDRRAAARKYGLVAILVLAAIILASDRDAGSVAGIVLAAILIFAAILILPLWPLLGSPTGPPMAPLIAFVGCDGSGKSTLSTDILAEVARDRSIQLCYLGLGSGAIGERIRALPLIGRFAERKLVRKAGQTRTTGQKIPGLPTAIVVYLFSLARLRRFRRMLALRGRGIAVITDRYPQVEVPGFYDGPGLSAGRPGSRLVAALARQELRLYRWMAGFRPDVVIRLNIDIETAAARKPDHDVDLLRRKVEVTPLLRFDGARIVDLDSRRPYAEVRAAAKRIVEDSLGRPVDPIQRVR